jgi:hypothetical protein
VKIVKKILFIAIFLGILLFIAGCILGITIPLADQANRKIAASILFYGAAILSLSYAGLLVNEYRVGKVKNGGLLLIIHCPFFTTLGIGFIFLASMPELVFLIASRRCF